MGSIYFNGSELTGTHDVKFNGSNVDNVYFNGSKIWTQHPYTPGTLLITQGIGHNSTFSEWITTHWGTYGTVMFVQQPYTHSGSPGSDYRIYINLQSGFTFSYFSRGDCTDTSGGHSSTVLYSGNSVTGATGFTCAEGGGASSSSGNGTSTIKVSYTG